MDKFINPVDFIVMDMEKNRDVPLIIGRPFLVTEYVMIVVKKMLVTFRVNGEKVMFDAKSIPHYPKETVGCFIVQVLNKVEAKAVENDVINELFLDSLVIEEVYDSPCIWDVEVEDMAMKKA